MTALNQTAFEQFLNAHVQRLLSLSQQSRKILRKNILSEKDLPQIRTLIRDLKTTLHSQNRFEQFPFLSPKTDLPQVQSFMATHSKALEELEKGLNTLEDLEKRLSPPPSCAAKLAIAAASAFIAIGFYYISPSISPSR